MRLASNQIRSDHLGFKKKVYELQFDPRHCQPAYKGGTFQVCADDRCIRAWGSLYRPYSPIQPPRLDCTLRLILHLQVLVPAVLLSSSTKVIANASFTSKILALVPNSIRNLMTACRKNFLHRLDIANLFPPDLWGYVYRFSYWWVDIANLSPPDLMRFWA